MEVLTAKAGSSVYSPVQQRASVFFVRGDKCQNTARPEGLKN